MTTDETLYWQSGETGSLNLELTREEAETGSHSGQCQDDIEALLQEPHIAEQVNAWSPATMRRELEGYGAWDEEQLADDQANRERLLWLACGDMLEEARENERD